MRDMNKIRRLCTINGWQVDERPAPTTRDIAATEKRATRFGVVSSWFSTWVELHDWELSQPVRRKELLPSR